MKLEPTNKQIWQGTSLTRVIYPKRLERVFELQRVVHVSRVRVARFDWAFEFMREDGLATLTSTSTCVHTTNTCKDVGGWYGLDFGFVRCRVSPGVTSLTASGCPERFDADAV